MSSSILVNMNSISISTGCLPRLEGCQFYELSSIIRMMKRFLKESNVDGFEFVLLPEWDRENPPLTPTSAPFECEKHSVEEVFEVLRNESFPILSVHANRDVGNFLCAEEPEKVAKGTRLIDECLRFAEDVNSKVCVFHFWDTWKESLDLARLEALYDRFQVLHPEIEISVENIPTKCRNRTPFQIMQNFKHQTLDLKWASMFNELDAFAENIEHVNNIHIQGKYQDGILVPNVGKMDYREALRRIKMLGYSGVFTVELEGEASYDDILRYVDKLKRSMV